MSTAVRRALFTANPGYGHVHPLLPLAIAFRRRGWEVVFATGPDLVDVPRRHGFAAWSTGLSMDETERRYRARFPGSDELPPSERMRLVAAHMFGDVAARTRAADLIPLAERWQPDLVVHDVTEFAGPVTALRLGIPVVAHAVSMLNPAADTVAAVAPVLDDLAREWGVEDGAARVLEAPYLDLCPPGLARPVPNPYHDVRPIRAELPPDPSGRLPDGLAELPYDRTLLVTLGTVVNTIPGAFDRLLGAIRNLPVNIVVSVGPNLDPSALGPQPEHVLTCGYVPYDALIPRCTAVLGHAGAGTLLATLSSGLPSVLVPQGAEQIANALATDAAGAAIALPPDCAAPEAIRAAVERVLDDSRYRAAACRLGAEIADRPRAEDVVASLDPVPVPS
jgi:UDP:flavonoid glycosyltransferase YjiC (YdhE family)